MLKIIEDIIIKSIGLMIAYIYVYTLKIYVYILKFLQYFLAFIPVLIFVILPVAFYVIIIWYIGFWSFAWSVKIYFESQLGFFLWWTFTLILWIAFFAWIVLIPIFLFRNFFLKIKLLKIYYFFLKEALGHHKLFKIFKIHRFLFLHFNRMSRLANRESYLLSIPLDLKGRMEDIYTVLHNITWNDRCVNISKPIEVTVWYMSFFVNKGKDEAIKLRDTLIAKKTEFLRKLPWYDDGDSIYEFVAKDTESGIKIEIFNTDEYWVNQTINLHDMKITKGNMLLWYYPEFNKNTESVEYKNYEVPSTTFIHSLFRGATGSGKDATFRNLVFSIIKNIKEYGNFEMYAFDSKWHDLLFLSWLEPYGIYRYSNIESYVTILEKLENEMKERLVKIWNKENYVDYNSTVDTKSQIKEIFVVINEFSSLLWKIDKTMKATFLSKLKTLLSESRASGIHINIISQSFRKDQDKDLPMLLVNIQDKFNLRMDDVDEMWIAGKWLWPKVRDELHWLQYYTALHIKWSTRMRKFKAYFISKDDLQKYVEESFSKSFRFENEKIQVYYEKILRTKILSFRESNQEPYNLTRANWEELISYLKRENLIIQNPNNSFSFVEKTAINI